MSPELRDLLDGLDRLYGEAPATERAAIIAAVSSWTTGAAIGMLNGRVDAQAPPEGQSVDVLLTRKQAAARLGVAPSWLSRRKGRLTFEVGLGNRTPRYSSLLIDKYIRTRSARG